MLLELCSPKRLFFHSIFEVLIPFIHACNNASNDFDQDQYSVSKRKFLIYGLSSATQVKAKLPKLTLPKFCRDLTYWMSFWDSFESAVHKNLNVESQQV